MAELFWLAEYNDGTQLPQIEPDGTKNAYHDIDQSKLVRFVLHTGSTEVVAVPLAPGERLIWRRRIAMTLSGDQTVCHIVGKRTPVDGSFEVSSVICVFEADGRTITADNFDEQHPWLYPPQLHDHEGG